jgi:hypothetical protein
MPEKSIHHYPFVKSVEGYRLGMGAQGSVQ